MEFRVLAESKVKITKWKVKEGYQVSSGQVILLYVDPDGDSSDLKRLKAPKVGVVQKIFFADGEIVAKGDTLLMLAECSHTTVIKDMCADCGADLRQNEHGAVSDASIPMVHSVPELKVSHKLAQKLGKADTERLLGDKKLVLLVDLDQTLIHTTNDNVPHNLKGVNHFQLYGPNSPWYHTRLRPGTGAFLTNMAPYFELHICTFGVRNYAQQIAMFLDEKGDFFSHRILSRDECLSITSKTDNLKALFPCGDSMVCIIDDREDVWNMAPNLIQVKPYHFFQHTGDINAPPGMSKHELDGKGVAFNETKETSKESSKSENSPVSGEGEAVPDPVQSTNTDSTADTDQTTDLEKAAEKKETTLGSETDDHLIELEDPDDYLLYLEQILLKIHARFYEIYEKSKEIPDLKVLIPKMRAEVLVDKSLVFSGLVPNHQKLEQSRVYHIARGVGATITQDLTDETTHLVAAAAGTIKVIAARKRTNIKIVTPDWLWCCAERWEIADERLFPLDATRPPSKMRQPPLHCHSPEHTVNYNNEKSDSSSGENSKKFQDTINPLLIFSNADLAAMNKDYDQCFESSSEDDGPEKDGDSESDGDNEDENDESNDNETPPMRKSLKRPKEVEDSKEDKLAARELSSLDDNYDSPSNEDTRDGEKTSSSEEEMPSAKFRRGGELPSDLELGSNSEGSADDQKLEDDGDWNMLGAELEREFLGSD